MIWGKDYWNNRRYSNTIGSGHFADYQSFVKSEINARFLKSGYVPPTGTNPDMTVKAYVNHGRWVADCPLCNGAEIVWYDDPRFVCLSCYNQAIGGQFLKVEFPDDIEQIEDILQEYIIPHQNWHVGETIEELLARDRPGHMSWTAPRTWTTGEIVTAAMMNTDVRDNMLETAPSDVTTAGDLVYATAANALTRLAIGTADQFLQVNSGATAVEWVTRKGTVASDYVATDGGEGSPTRNTWTDITDLSITLNPGSDRFAIAAWVGFQSTTGDDNWQIRIVIGATNCQESAVNASLGPGFAVGATTNNTASTTVKGQYYVSGSGTGDTMNDIHLVAIAVPD